MTKQTRALHNPALSTNAAASVTKEPPRAAGLWAPVVSRRTDRPSRAVGLVTFFLAILFCAVAAFVPAPRATRLDPVEALRAE